MTQIYFSILLPNLPQKSNYLERRQGDKLYRVCALRVLHKNPGFISVNSTQPNPSLTSVKTSSVTFNEQISEEIQCKCRLAIINENGNNFPTNKTGFCSTNKI